MVVKLGGKVERCAQCSPSSHAPSALPLPLAIKWAAVIQILAAPPLLASLSSSDSLAVNQFGNAYHFRPLRLSAF